MKSLFDNLSAEVSKMTTRTYSTSFSWGISLLNPRLRNAVYSVYGFVRLADEIVDSFHGYDKKQLLSQFKKDTHEAIERRISLNPILNSFQQATCHEIRGGISKSKLFTGYERRLSCFRTKLFS